MLARPTSRGTFDPKSDRGLKAGTGLVTLKGKPAQIEHSMTEYHKDDRCLDCSGRLELDRESSCHACSPIEVRLEIQWCKNHKMMWALVIEGLDKRQVIATTMPPEADVDYWCCDGRYTWAYKIIGSSKPCERIANLFLEVGKELSKYTE